MFENFIKWLLPKLYYSQNEEKLKHAYNRRLVNESMDGIINICSECLDNKRSMKDREIVSILLRAKQIRYMED